MSDHMCVCSPAGAWGLLTGAAQACLSVCPSVCLSDILRRCLVSDHMRVCAALQARGQLTGAAQARWRHTMGPAGIKGSAFQRVRLHLHHLLMQCTARSSRSTSPHATHCPLITFTTCSNNALPTHRVHHLLMQCTARSSRSPSPHATHCPLITFTTCSSNALPTHRVHHLLMPCTAHASYALLLLCKCIAIVLSRNTICKSKWSDEFGLCQKCALQLQLKAGAKSTASA